MFYFHYTDSYIYTFVQTHKNSPLLLFKKKYVKVQNHTSLNEESEMLRSILQLPQSKQTKSLYQTQWKLQISYKIKQVKGASNSDMQ